MELTIEQFNSKYQMEVIDLVGTIYALKRCISLIGGKKYSSFYLSTYKLASQNDCTSRISMMASMMNTW